MLRTSTRRLLLVLPLLGAVFVGGCEKPGRKPPPPSVTPLACPNFQLQQQTAHATPAGNTVDLGDGSSVTFAPGAVQADADYTVGYVTDANNARLAGFSIYPAGTAPKKFHAPVTIQISYNQCMPAGNPTLTIVTIVHGNPSEKIGGHKDANAKNVHVDVGHFTEYAIAL